jgi:hypothetical protein
VVLHLITTCFSLLAKAPIPLASLCNLPPLIGQRAIAGHESKAGMAGQPKAPTSPPAQSGFRGRLPVGFGIAQTFNVQLFSGESIPHVSHRIPSSNSSPGSGCLKLSRVRHEPGPFLPASRRLKVLRVGHLMAAQGCFGGSWPGT